MVANLFEDPRVAGLLGHDLSSVIASTFASVEIAEDEIAKARGDKFGVDHDDPLWRAFGLLKPTHDLMRTEFVYRAHCRELLGRITARKDTRPATDAEITLGIADASQTTPLHGDVVALQMRLFARAYPEQFAALEFDLDAYERVHGPGADEWERKLRHRLRHDWRKEA